MSTSIDEWVDEVKDTLARGWLVRRYYPEAVLGTLPNGKRVFMAKLDGPVVADLIAETRSDDGRWASATLSPLVYVVPYHTLKGDRGIEVRVYSIDAQHRTRLVDEAPPEILAELGNWALRRDR